MYLIKEICFNPRTQHVEVENGTQINILGKSKAKSFIEYWGKIDIYLEDDADFSNIPPVNKKRKNLLPYANEYRIENINTAHKELFLRVGTYQPENIDGFMIFVHHTGRELDTNGQKIFGNDGLSTSVIILRNREYLVFEGRKIEVINKQLVMLI